MTDFNALKRSCMDVFTDKVQPLLTDHKPGHIWTGRLELQGIIEKIKNWQASDDARCADLFDQAASRELLEFFCELPSAKFTWEECVAGLKAETMKWTNGRGHT